MIIFCFLPSAARGAFFCFLFFGSRSTLSCSEGDNPPTTRNISQQQILVTTPPPHTTMVTDSAGPRFPQSIEEYQSLLPLNISDDLLKSWVSEFCTPGAGGSKRFSRKRYATLLENHFKNDTNEVDKEDEEEELENASPLVATGITIHDDVPAYLMELVSREYLNDIKAMNVARFCYKVSSMHLRDAFALCIYVTHLLYAFT